MARPPTGGAVSGNKKTVTPLMGVAVFLDRKLGDAQRAMISDPDWQAPYYWAGYRLSGTNRVAD